MGLALHCNASIHELHTLLPSEVIGLGTSAYVISKLHEFKVDHTLCDFLREVMYLEQCRCYSHPPSDVVVLLLGFWGAQPRILHKYAALFNSKGHDVLIAVAPYMGIMLKSRLILEPFAQAVGRRARDFADGRALAVVSMSNGGCFPLHQLYRLRARDDGETDCCESTVELVVDRACYVRSGIPQLTGDKDPIFAL